MADSELDKLNKIDLTKISVGDLAQIRNDVLRRAILDVVAGVSRPPEHHSHATHSNHFQSIAAGPILDAPVVLPR